MPGRRSREEDIMWRAIITVVIAVITGGWGLIIGVFLFWPYFRALIRELSGSSPRVPPGPSLPQIISRGIYIEVPRMIVGEQATLRVGFRNLWNRTVTVEIRLDDLGRIGRLSSSSVVFTLRPGDYAERIVKITPLREGTFNVTVEGRVGVFVGRKNFTLRVGVPSEGPKAGTLQDLLSRYSDVSLIGEGGFGRVYRVRRRDGRLVALKVPHTLSEESGKVFLHEVSVWRELRHGNMVKLYDANLYPYPYIEMELCDGSLEGLKKPLYWEEAARLAFEICSGLSYAHSKGIIHRDLKPSNILLRGRTPKISDWGLSKVLKESGTTTKAVFTPYYAAPEQISPSKFGKTDERTDIWQLGVLMYELVTGRVPFDGEDFVEVAGRITMEEPAKPSELNPDAEPLEPVIMKCLRKRKEERYRSVRDLQRDLAELLGGKYLEELGRSVDFSRSAYYAGQLLLLHMKLSNTKEALKYASDLKKYARGESRRELEKLIEELEIRLREGLPIPEELVERAEVLVHDVSGA